MYHNSAPKLNREKARLKMGATKCVHQKAMSAIFSANSFNLKMAQSRIFAIACLVALAATHASCATLMAGVAAVDATLPVGVPLGLLSSSHGLEMFFTDACAKNFENFNSFS